MTQHTALKCSTLIVWLLYALSFTVHAAPLDKSAIKSIVIQLDPDTLNQFGLSASQHAVLEQVQKNLTEWQFPLVLSATANTTHNLDILIGSVEQGSTPVGFSFSSGNSDPRAQNFQKANVLPIQCRLTAKQHPEQQAELNMTFDASNKISLNQLVDHISTVCFDLLDDLHIDRSDNSNESGTKILKTPAWMPKVKVETIKEPQVKMDDKENQANVPMEEHKQLIIENQGSPVILKLGHERK
jgi:hypothetical protein